MSMLNLGKEARNILLVEDNEGILFNLKLTLELSDFNVVTAQNGREAIKLLEELPDIPSLILSDIMMPEMGGFDFFAYISTKEKWNKIPFIFLSAKTSPREIRFGKILGADDYLTKPVNQNDLINAINNKIHYTYLIKPKIEERIIAIFENNQISSQIYSNKSLIYYISENNEPEPTLKYIFCNLPQSQKIFWEKLGIQLYKSVLTVIDELGQLSSSSLYVPLNFRSNLGILFVLDINPSTKTKNMIFIISNLLNYFNALKLKYQISEFLINNSLQLDFEFENLNNEIEQILNE